MHSMYCGVHPFKESTMDYPFTSWTGYFGALTEHLSTEYYGETYPKYAKQHDKGNTETKMIQQLLASGLDPQEGLDGFIQALLDGHRYVNEFDEVETILEMFIEKGAKPNIDCLFEIQSTEFEDEVASYEIRGRLIDCLCEFGIDVKKYFNWASVDAVYWEDIEEEQIEEDYEKACRMALKSQSEFLREQ